MLYGKKILIGITGGIAAYKIPLLIRALIKEGAEVKVITTSSALSFVTPLTLSTLSTHPVVTDFTNDASGKWNSHVELGLWADLFILAPLTCNTMGKMVSGQCDNVLMATYLSARCSVVGAPAMDLDMFAHPTTQNNMKTLAEQGVRLVGPATGELASGLSGEGRMVEPEEIIAAARQALTPATLAGKKILISAGPTYENIDPVRFIGNYSSGKMGYAIAEEALSRGAEVVLVSGPSNLSLSHENLTLRSVRSANDMLEACLADFDSSDIAVMSAAVADYAPAQQADQKIKKNDSEMTLGLTKTTDVLKTLGEKKTNQLLVGFALETENEQANAKAKIEKKNLDFIVLNSLNNKGAGFQHDTNQITIIDRDNKIDNFELKSKSEVAIDILNRIEASLDA